ncbi:tail fiber assembly protein [Cronobacter dublinensis]|nr:tail fiber assembly protein [Cronobacter dublinensis]
MTQAIFKEGLAIIAGDITIHNFDAVTGEYIGSSVEYIPPGVGLPAFSTAKNPPEGKEGHARCFRNGEWLNLEDFRGQVAYSIINGDKKEITEPGPVGEGFVFVGPSTPFDVWDGKRWVTDVAAEKKAAVSEAEAQKRSRLASASAVIEPLKDADEGGFIEAEDKPRLEAWLKYRYQLTRIDTSAAPDIEWPEMPGDVA